MAKKRTGSFSLGPNFEEKFIKDMVSKPDISIIELVSNAWDAGATEVHITWPIVKEILDGEIFKIIDNGQGMTEDEFYKYWQELGVDKRKNLGHVYPCTFDTIIRNGELRTLDLIKKLEKAEGISVGDPEINEVMREEDAQTHLP